MEEVVTLMRRRPADDQRVRILAYDPRTKTFGTKPQIVRFLRGPVPWDWIEAAAKLPGRALAVGLCLWRAKGMSKATAPHIRLGSNDLKSMAIDRRAKSRALAALEAVGLVSIKRRPGRLPEVIIRS